MFLNWLSFELKQAVSLRASSESDENATVKDGSLLNSIRKNDDILPSFVSDEGERVGDGLLLHFKTHLGEIIAQCLGRYRKVHV